MTHLDIFGHKERLSARTSYSTCLREVHTTAHGKVINKELHELCLTEQGAVRNDPSKVKVTS